MACTKCKQKNQIREEIEKTTESISKGVIWFVAIWTALALYGLYSLVSKFL